MFWNRKKEKTDEATAMLRRENVYLKEQNAHYQATFDQISDLSGKIAKGDLSARIIHWDHFDTLSPTLAQLNQAFDLTDAYVREASASLEAALDKRYYRRFLETGMQGDFKRGAQIINAATQSIKKQEEGQRHELKRLATEFETYVMALVDQIDQAAKHTRKSADELMEGADENQRLATTVAAASKQATMNVQTVAAASEQLTSSVEEIARQVTTSLHETEKTSEEAAATEQTIKALSQSSETIGTVIKLISDIAEQTNLLALNATIEAARAGEAGKGFAVVASEVKNLAQQTASATGDINHQVSDIQNNTSQSVRAVDKIGRGISSLKEIAAAISAATEEQSAATSEISRNIQEAATGTKDVTANIGHVSATAQQTKSRAQELHSSSVQLEDQIHNLKIETTKFLQTFK
ncbi:methyl-accepting chemotaxis protein [Temperatibacter marinus]|uniref:Methyl-accepting chemotaxis protein n=1 Tax=Temperatibacter marinus TaxID=1456591 RepID=A0AA52EHB0_9PROT|nr:methyl-accepting chemotaxis protein [Temperatibacter marinus]WND03153.1 methyl-accepting chemotaxis protein [Temperatibacter marinus]